MVARLPAIVSWAFAAQSLAIQLLCAESHKLIAPSVRPSLPPSKWTLIYTAHEVMCTELCVRSPPVIVT